MTSAGQEAREPGDLERFAALEGDRERRRLLAAHPALRSPETVRRLCEEAVRLLRVDLDRAEAAARAAGWLADELSDEQGRALSLRADANVLLFRREFRDALGAYEEALGRFERLGEEGEAAITRSSALQCLFYFGEYDRAHRWAARARQIFDRLGDRLRLARLEFNVGSMLSRQDRFDEALAHFQSAYREFRRVGSPEDVGASLRNIAVCHQDRNDFVAALETYEEARTYCRANDLPLLGLEVEYNIAYLHYLRGEYAEANRLFEITRQTCDRLEDRHHRALCDLDQSEIYLELNMVREAAGLAGEALHGFRDLGMRYEAAKSLTNLAIARSRRGGAAEALALLAEAREIFAAEGNQIWMSLVDLYRALVYHMEGRIVEARQLASTALERFSGQSLPTRSAMCEILLAQLELEGARPAGALRRCAAALEILEPLDVPALEFQVHVVRGLAAEARGDAEGAMQALRRAHVTLERLRSHLQIDDLKVAFLADKSMLYEGLVALSLGQGAEKERAESAFAWAETSKSRGLVDLMSFGVHRLGARSEAQREPLERLNRLREELNWYYRQLDLRQREGGDAARHRVQTLRREIRGREERLQKALREVQITDREMGSIQAVATVAPGEIRATIPEGTVLLEYFFARGLIYAFVVRRRGIETLNLGRASRVRGLHRHLQFQLSRMRFPSEHRKHAGSVIEESTRAHMESLSELLLAPVLPRLEARHLVVVPHDFLHYLPIHALPAGDGGALIDRFTVSYAPSAGIYSLCQAKANAEGGRPLVLGVADERAPYIEDEVRAVAEALPGSRRLSGAEVDEESLRRLGERARILHLAAHGFYRRDNPMFSAIQLGSSRLSLFDLYNLKLSADLVVLSGCGTGLSSVRGGDELVGLSRGLLFAGARSVLVTLWDVNDESTYRFMRSFYRHLARAAPGAALREAMRETRERYPEPYFWAPFVLIGKPG